MRSILADKYLTGLKGVEIGGGAHNAFDLDTINVDITDDEDTIYKVMERRDCGNSMPVDVVANGDDLPFPDKSFDFVISSHVLEHFYDPIKALKEWARVARRYIFMIVPHKERTFDISKPRTTLQELIERHGKTSQETPQDDHWSVWITEDVLELCRHLGLEVIEYQDVDDKVGNGFAIVIKI